MNLWWLQQRGISRRNGGSRTASLRRGLTLPKATLLRQWALFDVKIRAPLKRMRDSLLRRTWLRISLEKLGKRELTCKKRLRRTARRESFYSKQYKRTVNCSLNHYRMPINNKISSLTRINLNLCCIKSILSPSPKFTRSTLHLHSCLPTDHLMP